MKSIEKRHLLYSNGTFDNKGCEALMRGAYVILNKVGGTIAGCTTCSKGDESLYKELGIVLESVPRTRNNLLNIISALFLKMKMRRVAIYIPYPRYKKLGKQYSFSYSMGGDNYCYAGQESFYRINRNTRNNGSVNVFWGCSIEESLIDELMLRDLQKYDYIFARESITYESLKKRNLTNVLKCTDPAFLMNPKQCHFIGEEKSFIGINISPLTLNCNPNPDKMFECIVYSISKILEVYDTNIILIPHVYGAGNDYDVHKRIKERINNDRLLLVGEQYDAAELKYIIGKAEAFIGSRTHSTIAAYSMCVPTLVLGYSVKSRGIAQDLFGAFDGYVVRVQDNYEKDELFNAFSSFLKNKETIKKRLKSIMPAYTKEAFNVLRVFGEEKNEDR